MIDILAMKRSTTYMGNRKYGTGGGGDGGVAERQAVMKAEQDDAIARINGVFGKGDGAPIYETRIGKRMVTHGAPESGSTYTVEEPYEYQAIASYDTEGRDKNAAERTKLYGTITEDASARLLGKLGEDRDVASRGSRFQLARQGLGGGSADVDAGRELLQRYQEGSLEAGTAALAAGNSARSADERTRVGIINNIRNGMASSDALSASFAGLENNANEARDAAMQTNIGGFFDDINNLNNQRQFNMGLQSGQGRGRSGNVFATSGNGGGNNGSISR